MKFDFSGIILSDKLYSLEDIVPHCRKKLKNKKLPEWEAKIYQFIFDFLDDKDYIVQYSSGTTGTPKRIELPKEAMIKSAESTIEKLNLKWTNKALLCLPVDYIAGKMMIVRSFVAGLNLFWEEPSSMPSLSKYGQMDFCAMVPLQVYNSFSNYEFFKNIRNLIIGGSELRSEIMAMFRDVPNNTYETYGMAETCSHIALRKISGEKPDRYFEVLPNISIRTDERDCLVIQAPYFEKDIVTNDVVELVDDKHFIWKGRIDNLINTGGIKIKPEELEAGIETIIDEDCAVIGVEDSKLGQKIVLVIESPKELDTKSILKNLKEHLEPHQVPKEIVYLEELPRTTSFKLDRSKLEQLLK